jgi:CRP-like cAMP-binding protein
VEPVAPPQLQATTEVRVSEAWVEETARRDDGLGLSPLLADLAPGEVAAMVGGLKLVTKGPGSILLTEGEPGDSLFILTTGVARVYRRDASGHNFQVATLRDGDFFGEAALLTGQPRTATITAATDCELLVLDRATFEMLAAAYPRVRFLVEEFHAQRSRRWPAAGAP